MSDHYERFFQAPHRLGCPSCGNDRDRHDRRDWRDDRRDRRDDRRDRHDDRRDRRDDRRDRRDDRRDQHGYNNIWPWR